MDAHSQVTSASSHEVAELEQACPYGNWVVGPVQQFSYLLSQQTKYIYRLFSLDVLAKHSQAHALCQVGHIMRSISAICSLAYSTGVGITKALFVIFSVREISELGTVIIYFFRLRSYLRGAAATWTLLQHVKYERRFQLLTSILWSWKTLGK